MFGEEAKQLAAATVWVAGREPQPLDGQPPGGGVRWFDVGPEADVESLLGLLGRHCEGLEREMLEELLAPDDVPEGKRWQGGDVRLASSFAVYPPDALGERNRREEAGDAAEVVYQPVELLAGEEWLVTRWHDARRYRGAGPVGDPLPPLRHTALLEAVAQRWAAGPGGNAGDLGVLVLDELALTYAPTYRRLYLALEQWELQLYGFGVERVDEDRREEELRNIWGARARLREWLNPLNVAGISRDPDKAWLPALRHEEVVAVDDRIDRALLDLLAMGETLRSSFQMLHIQKSEAQREEHEATQRRIEALAAAFLIPTLIVGFYGANTWVPGEQQHWGFWVMVAVMAVLTVIGVTAILVMHRRRAGHRSRALGS